MFTILGATGFIGRHLTAFLKQRGYNCQTPSCQDETLFHTSLGHVVYCIGLTADFCQHPFDTVEAHVCLLKSILQQARFDSFLYLSSTRVYQSAQCTEESASLSVNPANPGDLYNLSKLMGESLCFATQKPNVRVVRLSNIVGNDFSSRNFLIRIIQDAFAKKHVTLETALSSEKDYLSIQDLVSLLPEIARSGKYSLYNVASGINTSHQTILEQLQKFTGCSYDVKPDAPKVCFPKISVSRIQEEFGLPPRLFHDVMEELMVAYSRDL